MEREDFRAILSPLVLAMRAEFDAPTWTAYFRVLGDVPSSLLAAVVDAMMREPREFFPKAGELRGACERRRRVLLAAHQHTGCIDCEDSVGWRAIKINDVARVERCPCVARHRDKLASLGIAEPLAQLPGEVESGGEAVYPSIDQLPASERQQLLSVVRQKVMR